MTDLKKLAEEIVIKIHNCNLESRFRYDIASILAALERVQKESLASDEILSVLNRVAEYGPPQGEKEDGIACGFCDMGGAGYATRGDGFHDDECATKDAQLILAKLAAEKKAAPVDEPKYTPCFVEYDGKRTENFTTTSCPQCGFLSASMLLHKADEVSDQDKNFDLDLIARMYCLYGKPTSAESTHYQTFIDAFKAGEKKARGE